MNNPMVAVISGNMKSLDLLKDTLATQFKDYMSDESESLFDRWNFFMEHSHKILPCGNWTSDMGSETRKYLENLGYLSRYESRKYSDVFEEESYHPYKEEDEDEEWKSYVESWIEEHKELVKEIITGNFSGFTWDW